MTEPIVRPAGRIILIGPGGRALLFRGGDPHRPGDGTWWFTPGGGVDPGETALEACHRELWEETGHREVKWSGLVARREAIFVFMGATYLSQEDFYVAHTTHLDVSPVRLTAVEQKSMEEHRWLDAVSMRRLTEPIYPVELPDVLSGLAARRYPASPWVWS